MDRSQTLLLPESVEDYVSAQHPVRFLDAFVEGLDLKACGFARNMKRVINLVGMARLLEAVRRLVAATAQLLEAFLEVLSARGHPEEANGRWPRENPAATRDPPEYSRVLTQSRSLGTRTYY